ncbi:MAG TPA: prevent-host-death protein [Sulfuricurvum sp.]|nr:prevent-host-death protein [Sulfuricurvum sp.]
MIMTITANEVKTKGVSAFDGLFEKFNEIIINVRGKNKYCVIPFDEYEDYRAYKLDKAYKEVVEDIEEGRFHTDIQKHFDTIEGALDDA